MNLFEAIFKHDPSSIAIHFGERRISYGELRAETLRMVQVVRSHGVNRGDRVALLLHDSPEFVEAFVAGQARQQLNREWRVQVFAGASVNPVENRLRLAFHT